MPSVQDYEWLQAEIERLRAALKAIAENSEDVEACAVAWSALMKMKPATRT